MTVQNEKENELPVQEYISIIDDDETIRRMTHYFKQPNSEDLMRYIKRYGIHRHASTIEELH